MKLSLIKKKRKVGRGFKMAEEYRDPELASSLEHN